jgi:hypothetical protein
MANAKKTKAQLKIELALKKAEIVNQQKKLEELLKQLAEQS